MIEWNNYINKGQVGNKLMEILAGALYIAAIVIVCLVISRILRKGIVKIIRPGKSKNSGVVSEKRAKSLQSILSSAVKYGIYFIIIYAVSDVLTGSGTNPFLAVAGAVGVALGLGAQDLVKDVIAGFFIIFEDQFSIGDIVEIAGQMGTIEEIGLRTTRIRGFSGQLFILPNGGIQMVVNWSRGQAKAIVDISVGYGENMDRVLALLENEMSLAFEKEDDILERPAVMGITGLNDYNVSLRITAACKPGTHWSVERTLRRYILNRFEKEGVKPPYPVTGIVNALEKTGGTYGDTR